jgi:hypothetical protein
MVKKKKSISCFFGETVLADVGLCAHGVPDDDSCGECRLKRCGGGRDCGCGGKLAAEEDALQTYEM